MIAITPEIREAIEQAGGAPVHLEDPLAHRSYVLLDRETYERLQALLDDEEDRVMAEEMFPRIKEVFGPEGWDDPAMDIYEDLDPRRP